MTRKMPWLSYADRKRLDGPAPPEAEDDRPVNVQLADLRAQVAELEETVRLKDEIIDRMIEQLDKLGVSQR